MARKRNAARRAGPADEIILRGLMQDVPETIFDMELPVYFQPSYRSARMRLLQMCEEHGVNPVARVIYQNPKLKDEYSMHGEEETIRGNLRELRRGGGKYSSRKGGGHFR